MGDERSSSITSDFLALLEQDRTEDISNFMTVPTTPSIPPPAAYYPASSNFKKAKWTPEEDQLLIQSVTTHGTTNWTIVSHIIPGRSGKQCRERWLNQLNPELTKNTWTPEEDEILIQKQAQYGNKWSEISKFLPGRSGNNIKNRWSYLSRHRIPMVVRSPPVDPNLAQQTVPPEVQWGQGSAPSSATRGAFSEPVIMQPILSYDSMNSPNDRPSPEMFNPFNFEQGFHFDNEDDTFNNYDFFNY